MNKELPRARRKSQVLTLSDGQVYTCISGVSEVAEGPLLIREPAWKTSRAGQTENELWLHLGKMPYSILTTLMGRRTSEKLVL